MDFGDGIAVEKTTGVGVILSELWV